MKTRYSSKIFVLIMVVSLLFAVFTVPASAATSFSDTKGHWAESYINSGVSAGYISGYSDGTFKPDKTVTRAEFAKMLNLAIGINNTTTISFSDVSSSAWYYSDVRKAVAAGYITGYDDGTFRANNNIARQEAAVIISRIITEPTVSKTITTSDKSSIASWALSGVNKVYAKGYMTGDANNYYRPTGNLTRAEAAKIIYSIVKNEKIVESNSTVSTAGTTVADTIYANNVTISSAVGDGSVTFNNCRVLGTMTVNGGGENTVTANDTGISNLIIAKSTGDVRFLMAGASYATNTTVNYGAKLQESGLTGDGFKDVLLSGSSLSSGTVQLVGSFNTVDVNSSAVVKGSGGTIKEMNINSKLTLTLQGGSITTFNIASAAAGSSVYLASGVTIGTANINGKAAFTGTGVINTAYQNVSGITYETAPKTILGSGSSTTGTLIPTITPSNASTNVDVDTTIKLVFSEAVYKDDDETSLTSSYIESSVVELREGSTSGDEIGFSASISSNKTITITPDDDLAEGTKYYIVVLADSVYNSDGDENDKTSSYFTTEGSGGALAPTITPTKGKTGVDVGTTIKLVFDEAVYKNDDKDALTSSYIKSDVVELRKGSATGTEVSFSASISNNKTITITPSDDLDDDTKYYVIVLEDSVYNSDGDENDKFTSYFTTESTGTLTPTITPSNGTTDVDVATTIKLVFSESVYKDDDETSITSSYIKSDIVELRKGSTTGTEVSFSASISNNKTITITPTDDLDEGTKYYVIVLADSVYNSDGDSNDKKTTYFTTEGDDTFVSTVTPSNASTGIAVDTTIKLVFDQSVYKNNDEDPLSSSYIKGSVIELRKGSTSGTEIGFTATISNNKTITITPSSDLATGTKYYVIVLAGSVYNSNGDENEKFTSYFTTGSGLPQLTTFSVSNVTATTAKLNLQSDTAGTATITLTPNGGTATTQTLTLTANTAASTTFTGLIPATTYTVSAYVTSSSKTSATSTTTFTTLTPSISLASSNIDKDSASITATYNVVGELNISYQVKGDDTTLTPVLTGFTPNSSTSYSVTLAGLDEATTYVVHATMTYNGVTYTASDIEFTTDVTSSDATLSSVSVIGTTGSYTASGSGLSLSANVGNETSVTIRPTASAGSRSTIVISSATITGDTVASGSISPSYTLSSGDNVFYITVTAEDGTTELEYTLTISTVIL